jgi:hypothetical protein
VINGSTDMAGKASESHSPTAVAQLSGFRNWRRQRPFWAGVWAILGGAIVAFVPGTSFVREIGFWRALCRNAVHADRRLARPFQGAAARKGHSLKRLWLAAVLAVFGVHARFAAAWLLRDCQWDRDTAGPRRHVDGLVRAGAPFAKHHHGQLLGRSRVIAGNAGRLGFAESRFAGTRLGVGEYERLLGGTGIWLWLLSVC